MPRLPTYDTPQVSTNALPNVRFDSPASPGLFSGGFPQQVGQLGEALGKAGAAALDIRQAEEVKQQETEALTTIEKLYKTFNDVHNKYASLEGEYALNAREEGTAEFDKLAQPLINAVTGPIARQAVEKKLVSLKAQLDGSLSTHVERERKQVNTLAATRAVDNAASAYMTAQNEEAKKLALANHEQAVLALLAVKGVNPESDLGKSERALMQEQLAIKTITHMLSAAADDAEGAKAALAFMDQNKDWFVDPTKYATLRDKLETTKNHAEIEKIATAMAEVGKDKKEIVDTLTQSYPSQYHKYIEQQARSAVSLVQSDKAFALGKIKDQLADWMLNNTGRAIPPGVWKPLIAQAQQIDPSSALQLQEFVMSHNDRLSREAEKVKTAEYLQEQAQHLGAFLALAASSPEAALRIDFTKNQDFNALDLPHRNEALRVLQSLRKEGGGTFGMAHNYLRTIAPAYGLSGEQVSRVVASLALQFRQAEDAGYKLSEREIKDAVHRAISKDTAVTIEGLFHDSKITWRELMMMPQKSRDELLQSMSTKLLNSPKGRALISAFGAQRAAQIAAQYSGAKTNVFIRPFAGVDDGF